MGGTVVDASYQPSIDDERRKEFSRTFLPECYESRDAWADYDFGDYAAFCPVGDLAADLGLLSAFDSAGMHAGQFWIGYQADAPDYKVYLHAMSLLDTFKHRIPNNIAGCEGARDEVERMMKAIGGAAPAGSDWTLFVGDAQFLDETSPCDGPSYTPEFDDCGLATRFESELGSLARTDRVFRTVHLCNKYLLGQALAADRAFSFAYFLHSAVREGRVVYPDGMETLDPGEQVAVGLRTREAYLDAAFQSARLGLSFCLPIAKTLLHELLHLHRADAWHCDAACCQERVAHRWQVQVASRLGLVQANSSTIDRSLDGVFERSMTCDVEETNEDWKGTLDTYEFEARLDFPGQPKGFRDYRIVADVVPDECQD